MPSTYESAVIEKFIPSCSSTVITLNFCASTVVFAKSQTVFTFGVCEKAELTVQHQQN